MVEVRLHGALAKTFGMCWVLDIRSINEAVEAIDCARNGFKAKIMELDRQGLVFRVRSKTHDFDNEEVGINLGETDRIDIIPVVRGASAGFRFIIGALLVISTFIPVSPTFGNPYFQAVGTSLMLGSVAEWLAPTPKKVEQQESLRSWTINGANNNPDQGQVIPVIFGEVITGSLPISVGINTAQLTPNEAMDSLVTIGGQIEKTFYPGLGGRCTVVMQYSVSPFNMAEPYTYSWSFTGFPGKVSSSISGQGTATMKLSLVYDGIDDQVIKETGDISVSVTGKETTGNPPDTITRTATVTSTVAIIYSGGE